MKVLECSCIFPVSLWVFFFQTFKGSLLPVHGRFWLNFKIVLVTCKNEEDPIKNEDAGVFTTLYIDFSDAQRQITPDSVVGSGRNLNSFKLSFIFLLPARMEMIQSKMKGLKIPIISLWGFFQILNGS